MATPQFKTLVYSPEVRIHIEGVDVSQDVVRGNCGRITGGASSLSFTLSNKGLRYNDRFRRMDRVAMWMKRVEWVLVFTGYLDSVPGLQLYPTTVTFKASCTLKRLLYTYWDPGLPESLKLLNQRAIPFGAGNSTTDTTAATTDAGNTDPNAPSGLDQAQGTAPGSDSTPTPSNAPNPLLPTGGAAPNGTYNPTDQKDAGLGQMLKNILEKVGGWDLDQIYVQTFPESFLGYVNERMPEIENLDADAVKKFKEMFDYDEATGASSTGGTPGGGGLSESTFTSIGPPANGSNYSDMELVWIVTNAGWSGEDVVIGCSIITAESSGRPDAINTANPDQSIDRGLWQINSIHDGMFPGENRMDPGVSTKIARTLYKNRGNWDDWSTLVYHGTAQQHFPRFRAIAATGGTAPPNSGTTAPANTGTAPPTGAKPNGGAQVISNTGATAPIASDPNQPDTSGMGVQDAIIAVTNYRFPGIFTVASKSRSEPGSYHDFSSNKAVDLSNGPGDGPSSMTPEMDQLAAWWKQNYLGKGILELIHWGPDNVWNDQPDGDGMSIYGASTMAQHYNHVHIAMDGVVSADGTSTAGALSGAGGAGGAGGSTSTFQNKLAKNIFTYLFDPKSYYDANSLGLTGRYASVNDQPLINIVRSLTEAGMREFQSGPAGDFLAFYPDYFGLDGAAPKMKLEDVEMKDVRININDDALTTHVFTMGANTFEGNVESNELGYMRSPGVVTVEDKFLFDRATQGSFFQPDVADSTELLARYGLRPLKKKYNNIFQTSNKESMLVVAIKLFMQKWAEQYQTTVEFTFMPELFPGMRIELVGHDLIVYVKSVNHNWDYESGFSTSAQVMAPMSASRTALQPVSDGS